LAQIPCPFLIVKSPILTIASSTMIQPTHKTGENSQQSTQQNMQQITQSVPYHSNIACNTSPLITQPQQQPQQQCQHIPKQHTYHQSTHQPTHLSAHPRSYLVQLYHDVRASDELPGLAPNEVRRDGTSNANKTQGGKLM
jgi:hypothetical protein